MQTALTIALAIALLGVFLVFLRRQKARRRVRLEEYSARFRLRQVQPDFAAFTARYGCEVPPDLRALQSDPVRMREADFEVHLPSSPDDSHYVAWFEPMDEEHMSIVWPGTEGLYPFANDGSGNSYLIDPRDAGLEVSFYDHETGERERLSVSLAEFLAARRTTEEEPEPED